MSKKRDIILKPKCFSHHSFGLGCCTLTTYLESGYKREVLGIVLHEIPKEVKPSFFIAVIPIQLPNTFIFITDDCDYGNWSTWSTSCSCGGRFLTR